MPRAGSSPPAPLHRMPPFQPLTLPAVLEGRGASFVWHFSGRRILCRSATSCSRYCITVGFCCVSLAVAVIQYLTWLPCKEYRGHPHFGRNIRNRSPKCRQCVSIREGGRGTYAFVACLARMLTAHPFPDGAHRSYFRSSHLIILVLSTFLPYSIPDL